MPIYIPKSPPTVVLLGLISAASVSLALAAQPKESGQSGASQPAASQQQGGATQQGSSARASTSGSAAGTASTQAMSGKLSRSDEKLLVQLAQANLAEINAGKLAQQKSENDRVKSYAQKMVDDHTKALDDLKVLAEAKGVTLPTESDRQHQSMYNRLSALSGEQFDRQYLDQSGSRAHRDTQKLLQKASSRAKDQDLKSYASRTLPTVENHEQMARDTKRELQTSTGKSGSGTEQGGGTSGGGASQSGSGASTSGERAPGGPGSGVNR